jgi:hypothetical protein
MQLSRRPRIRIACKTGLSVTSDGLLTDHPGNLPKTRLFRRFAALPGAVVTQALPRHIKGTSDAYFAQDAIPTMPSFEESTTTRPAVRTATRSDFSLAQLRGVPGNGAMLVSVQLPTAFGFT